MVAPQYEVATPVLLVDETATQQLADHIASSYIVASSAAAATAFILYDVILTFGDEVQYIWPLRWTCSKIMFLFIRYFAVMLQLSIQFIGTRIFSYSRHACYIWNVYQAMGSVMIVTSVDYVLILRVFAFYPRNSVVQHLTRCLYLAEVAMLGIGLGLSVPRLLYDEYCVVTDVPTLLLISACAPIFFQTVLFGLTAFKFIKVAKAGWDNIPVVQLIMRDGTWAFVLLFVVLTSEAVVYITAPKAYSGILYAWLNTVFAFCGYRILLNLCKVACPGQFEPQHSVGLFPTGTNFNFTSSDIYTNPGNEPHRRSVALISTGYPPQPSK